MNMMSTLDFRLRRLEACWGPRRMGSRF
uniref:Uncharacterized protein n=1 Tax=Arundo donax TaxID=35708 RepID=A0A0A8YUC0_ARUDO